MHVMANGGGRDCLCSSGIYNLYTAVKFWAVAGRVPAGGSCAVGAGCGVTLSSSYPRWALPTDRQLSLGQKQSWADHSSPGANSSAPGAARCF